MCICQTLDRIAYRQQRLPARSRPSKLPKPVQIRQTGWHLRYMTNLKRNFTYAWMVGIIRYQRRKIKYACVRARERERERAGLKNSNYIAIMLWDKYCPAATQNFSI